jgi:uncharacterized membrane protein
MRILGHPVHAVLVVFPLGLLTLVPLWDLLAWVGVPGAAHAGRFSEIAGLAGGVLAIVTGLVDLSRAEKSSAVESLATWHASAAVSGICLFAIALALRAKSAWLPIVALEAAGAACLAVAGWCGGHLVFHHGVAVRRKAGALPEAPEAERGEGHLGKPLPHH